MEGLLLTDCILMTSFPSAFAELGAIRIELGSIGTELEPIGSNRDALTDLKGSLFRNPEGDS